MELILIFKSIKNKEVETVCNENQELLDMIQMILNSDDYKTKQTTETEKAKSFNYYDEMEIIDINYYITSFIYQVDSDKISKFETFINFLNTMDYELDYDIEG